MALRLATKVDIPIMATVLAASFGPDRLFQILFPHQKEYPAAFVQAMEEYLWLSWYDYRKFLVVSCCDTTTEPDHIQQELGDRTRLFPTKAQDMGPRTVVIGLAEWERSGEGWESLHAALGRWDPRMTSTSNDSEGCFMLLSVILTLNVSNRSIDSPIIGNILQAPSATLSKQSVCSAHTG